MLALPICYVLGQISFFSSSFLKIPLKALQYAIILIVHAAKVPRHGQQSENLLPSPRVGLPRWLDPAGRHDHRALNEDDIVPIDTKTHLSDKYDFGSTIDKS